MLWTCSFRYNRDPLESPVPFRVQTRVTIRRSSFCGSFFTHVEKRFGQLFVGDCKEKLIIRLSNSLICEKVLRDTVGIL